MVALEPGSGMSHSSPENIDFGPHEVDETCCIALISSSTFPQVSIRQITIPTRYDTMD